MLNSDIIENIRLQFSEGHLLDIDGTCTGNSRLHGLHESTSGGPGIDFLQYTPYTPGDDLKNFDWRLFARTDTLNCRIQAVEQPLQCAIFLDDSSSMNYQGTTASMTKFDYASSIAAALSEIAITQGDNAFVTNLVHPFEILKGDTITHYLENHTPNGVFLPSTALPDTLSQISNGCTTLAIVISDFLEDIGEWRKALASLREITNQIMVIQILDSDELTLPFETPQCFVDSENSRHVVSDPNSIRKDYQKRISEHIASLNALFIDLNCKAFHCITDTTPQFR